jgi:uncharacterized membrane protein
MSAALTSLGLGFHALATVILIGQYILSALVILPVMQRHVPEQEQVQLLLAFSTASRPWMYGSLLVFAATGTLLMITDPLYLGFLQIGNAWSVLMIVKHVLLIPWVFLCISIDQNASRRLEPAQKEAPAALLTRFRRMNGMAAAGGVLIILMTSVMQAL